MANGTQLAEFARSYNSMSGADIKAVFGGKVFGELQAISYAVTREKAPIYTMGSPDPRAYSRNKRGIAGSFVWINFDRHSLLQHFNKSQFVADTNEIHPHWLQNGGDEQYGVSAANTSYIGQGSIEGVSAYGISGDAIAGSLELGDNSLANLELANPWYSDQIPPFDIVLVANNEYGASAKMKLIGVEILNDGLGISVDDSVIESQSTFVARSILPFVPVVNSMRDSVGQAGTSSYNTGVNG
jgi:hypothetical protein